MNSPVEVPYHSFITIDRESNTDIYMQIANQLINAIQRGFLLGDTKLPGTRQMSKILGVHRKTIISVYDELYAQGWVQVLPNKGTFVLNNTQHKSKQPLSLENKLIEYPQKTGFSFNKTNILDSPYEYGYQYINSFNDGVPDLRITPIHQHAKVYSANLKRKNNQHKIYNQYHSGNDYFREQLSYYLNLSRGLHISKHNLLITRSMEMSVYILSQILLNKNDIVLVGNLSYFAVNMVFQKRGVLIKTVSVDVHGINVDEVEQLCQQYPIKMLYLTPHHHYPTTVTLSAQRRVQLLNLASKYGFIIIEDDYDYDFQYEKLSVMPLASADTNGMVVYIGAFGKSLMPGLRLGFVVAPQNLILEMKKLLNIIDKQGDIMAEQVLGELIEEGEIYRHLKKSVKIYKERRDCFSAMLNVYLKDYISFAQPTGGLATWIEWNTPINLLKLSNECRKENLLIPKILLYQNKDLSAMRIGFGSFTPEEMEGNLKIMCSKIEITLKK